MNFIAKISILSEELDLKKIFNFLNFRRLKNCVIEGEEVKYSTIYKVSSIKQFSKVSKTKKITFIEVYSSRILLLSNL